MSDERVAVLHPYNPKHGDECSCAHLKPKRCEAVHPSLGNRCTLEAGHDRDPDRSKRGHYIDLGPNHPGPLTEEFLRAKGLAFRGLWRSKIKRGLAHDEAQQLKAMVEKFHATEEP